MSLPSTFSSLALVAREGGVVVEEVLHSDPAADECVVKIVSASICASDVKSMSEKGWLCPHPMIPGHEAAGIVVKVGAAADSLLQEGQSVILSFASCGDCRFCRRARPSACKYIAEHNFRGKRTNGEAVAFSAKDRSPIGGLFFGQSSFSQLALVHMSSVVPVALSISELKMACAFSCGVQTGAGSIFNICRPAPGDNILIFGCGGVGLAAIMAATLTTPGHLIAVDVNEDRLKLARSLGASHTINAQEDVLKRVVTITAGELCDFVLECAGQPSLLRIGHDCLANCGTLLTIGGPKHEGDTPPILIRSHLNCSKIYRGTHQGDSVPSDAIPRLIRLWRDGKFPIERLLTTYRWLDFKNALADMTSGTVIKPVLLFDDNDN